MTMLVVYCAQGSAVWVLRKVGVKTWQVACASDGFRTEIIVLTLADILKIQQGIVAHSVALRGAFVRTENWGVL